MEALTGGSESAIIYQKTYFLKGHITGLSGVQALRASPKFLSHMTHSISPTVYELQDQRLLYEANGDLLCNGYRMRVMDLLFETKLPSH